MEGMTIVRTLSLGIAALALAAGCSTGTSTPPRPYVIQFAGSYQSVGQDIELRPDGTVLWKKAGAAKEGRFEEETIDAERPRLVLFFADETASAVVSRGADRHALTFELAGTTEHLIASTQASTEELCEASGGTWLDDDRDPMTGLDCSCASGARYIPSQGGCTP
jgi:hypothetical protein